MLAQRHPTHGDAQPRAMSLAEVLAYRNDDVIDRFVVDNDADPDRAAEVFDDLKRWLWLCAEARRETELGVADVPTLTIFETQLELDEMWHAFILFTSEYVDFCFRSFGFFVHHTPTPERAKRAHTLADPQRQRAARIERAALRKRVAAYTYDKLGEDVARRWFLPLRVASHAGPEGVEPEAFHRAYRSRAPWEIGRPQPRVVELIAAGALRGDLLDLGCGTGENAIAIAAAGHRVLGVDLVPRAIEIAERSLEQHGVVGVRFEVADVLTLALDQRFDTILDSGVFHGFGDADRPTYVRNLARHLVDGGQLHILCFSELEGGHGPRRIREAEIRATFEGDGWEVQSIVPTIYEALSGPKSAWHAIVVRRGTP